MFDEIAGHFFKKNFGNFSKTDMEILMFKFYLSKKKVQGGENWNEYSDYRLSKELGITQQRVRNLKVKAQLIYPEEYDWKNIFAKQVENARWDSSANKVIISIPDPNLYSDIENFFEEHGAYIEKELNSKLMKLRIDNFLNLMLEIEPEEERKSVVKQLKKTFKSMNKEEKKFNEKKYR